MFLKEEEKSAGEPAKVGTLKLSEAIRKGLPIVGEDKARWRMCALGAAFAGVRGRMMNSKELCDFLCGPLAAEHAIADAIGFPRRVCAAVHEKHYAGMPAEEIAFWLESQGK